MIISLTAIGIVLGFLNVLGMIMMMVDKKRARRHMRRIPENRLMWIGCLGGAPLMLVTMYLIHHKTHRKKFTIGFPIAIVCMLALFLFMWNHPEWFSFYNRVLYREII